MTDWATGRDSLPSYGTSIPGDERSGEYSESGQLTPHPEPQHPALHLSFNLVFGHQDPSG